MLAVPTRAAGPHFESALGLMAIIGEITCIFAALFLVPAIVIVVRKLRHRNV